MLGHPHGVLRHNADPVVTALEVRGGRKMVLDDKAKLPHTASQKPELAPTLVLPGALIREYVHAGDPVGVSRIGRCIASGSVQLVVGNLS